MIFSSPRRTLRRGFTLVEMLVVVAIIGILAGLITAAAASLMRTAKKTVIATEFSELNRVLNDYKNKYGEYPPDGTNTSDLDDNGIPDSFERHFQRVFPKANLAREAATGDYVSELGKLYFTNKFPCDPRKKGDLQQFFQNYSPTTALTFWLGGMQEDNYTDPPPPAKNPKSRFVGFSANPICPLSDNASSKLPLWYEFDITRINDPSGAMASTTIFRTYRGNANVPSPYVYFRAEISQRGKEYHLTNNGSVVNIAKHYPLSGVAVEKAIKPYWDQNSKSWINATSYQILFCGFDNTFGEGNVYPTGKWISPPLQSKQIYDNYNQANNDDQANFIKGSFDAEMP